MIAFHQKSSQWFFFYILATEFFSADFATCTRTRSKCDSSFSSLSPASAAAKLWGECHHPVAFKTLKKHEMNEQKKITSRKITASCFLIFLHFLILLHFFFFSPLLLLCKLRTTYSFMNSKWPKLTVHDWKELSFLFFITSCLFSLFYFFDECLWYTMPAGWRFSPSTWAAKAAGVFSW